MNKNIKKLILFTLIIFILLISGCTENNSKLTDQESHEFKYSNDELNYYYNISENITYLKTRGTYVEINDYYEYINIISDNTIIILIHDNETERVFINPYFIEDESIIVGEKQRYVTYNKNYLFLTFDTFTKILHNIHHSIQVDYDMRK